MRVCLLSLLSLVWLASVASAHPLSPAAIALKEYAPHSYAVSFSRPMAAASTLTLDLPGHCRRADAYSERAGDQAVERFNLHCTHSLEGQTLRVFGLVELSLGAIVYLEFQSGETVRSLLGTHSTSLTIPAHTSSFQVFCDYLALGVEHLLFGFDHVLFVLGLLLLQHSARSLLLTLTAFTLGHSITLALSTFRIIALSQALAELGIALSLVLLALQILHGHSWRIPASVFAGSCGLLHGLGFAGALREIGFSSHAVPLSLLGFNVGVELGQLTVVALCVALVVLLACGAARFEALAQRWSLQKLRPWLAYGIGSISAMWCIERALF